MRRYDRLGRVYDVVSLEALLYRRARARLAELFGSMPGATIVDVGCGTGLNHAWLRRAVSPGGRIVGVDSSPSMLAAARRRTRRHDPGDVMLLEGDAMRLGDVLRAASVTGDAFVATFVLSLLPADNDFWDVLAHPSTARPRVAIADLGTPDTAPAVLRPILAALTSLGGGDPERRPWERLGACAPDLVHETQLGGHVHLTVGTCRGEVTGRET